MKVMIDFVEEDVDEFREMIRIAESEGFEVSFAVKILKLMAARSIKVAP